MVDQIGQQFGNYQLLRLLGQGGFADVYLGVHLHLNTQAAIKILQMRLVGNNPEQFRTEARTIAGLTHPHIVRVYDFGVQEGIPFLVMDYAANGTLRQRLPKGPRLPPASIIPYVRQVASALQYAHDRKLIHRDVKPENMLLDGNNTVLLSDFGLVQVAQSTGSRSMQAMGGTVPYTAPEQLQGKPRLASDQYSLAIVMYEWLSGELPFQGSFLEIASQQMLTPPPPLYGRIPGISQALEHVLQMALAKDPQQRFASIQAFATAFEQAVSGAPHESAISTYVKPLPDESAPSIPAPGQTSQSTFINTPGNQTSQSTVMNTPTNSSSQPTYRTPPSQPSQPMQSVPPPGNTSGPTGTPAPSSYGASPLPLSGANPPSHLPPSQYDSPTAPAPNPISPVRRRHTHSVKWALLVVLVLFIILGSAVGVYAIIGKPRTDTTASPTATIRAPSPTVTAHPSLTVTTRPPPPTATPIKQPPTQVVLPNLLVNPHILNASNCSLGGNNTYSCQVALGEDQSATVNWSVSDDNGLGVTFSPLRGMLSSNGSPQYITISNIPCQSGTFTFSGQGSNMVQVPWSCTSPPPTCTFSVPTGLDLGSVPQGQPASGQVIVSNTGGQALTWNGDTGGAGWVKLDTSSGTLQPGSQQPITVTADTSQAGSYSTTLNFSSSCGSGQVAVKLVVTLMQLSTTSLTFNLGCSNPQSQPITITNGGGGTLTWSAGSPSQSWLTVTSAANGGTPGTLTLQADPTGLSNGPYSATVLVSGSDGTTQTVTVTLNVQCIF